MSNEPLKSSPPPPQDWDLARPEKIPHPSLHPPAVALGVTLLVWGLISSPIVSAFGVVLFAVALAGWIKEIRHERKS
jgi:hypothetical protein